MRVKCGHFRTPILAAALLLVLARASPAAETVDALCENYLEHYFRMFPTRATQAGRHDLDQQLEDFSRKRIDLWLEFNRGVRNKLVERLRDSNLSADDRLDCESLLGQIDRERNSIATLARVERDPLYWSGVAADATIFLLAREDIPLEQRRQNATARMKSLPRFAQQGRDHFAHVDPSNVAPDFCQIAAGQLRATAKFYKDGFARAVNGDSTVEKESADAATALLDFAATLEQLGKRAKGPVRLGNAYAETFRVGTGSNEPVHDILARAQSDLIATRSEAAAYGRTVWSNLVPNESPPNNDVDLLRRLFDRIAADHSASVDETVAQWRSNADALNKLVHEKNIMTLPDPLTLIIDRSPDFFVGQSVGGVYPPGPYAPDAKTILFLPSPASNATPEQREAFFRDFNDHFNKMIAAHELIPGHYVQFKIAAHQGHKIRTVFPNPLYVEGWGTFCERLMLDQGWGGPPERLAHLKKQLENIARTIVDIRVHTENLSRDEVIHFVKDEALQGDQLASNMWTRAITSSPQITSYYLGYRKVRQAFDAARASAGNNFELQKFMDAMMELGPVQLDHYIEQFSAKKANGASQTPSPAK
jgi:Bacterial protein of unknown function (DUF885)